MAVLVEQILIQFPNWVREITKFHQDSLLLSKRGIYLLRPNNNSIEEVDLMRPQRLSIQTTVSMLHWVGNNNDTDSPCTSSQLCELIWSFITSYSPPLLL